MAMTKERLICLGFDDLAEAYQFVHKAYGNRRVPNGAHGGVRERRLITAAYSYRRVLVASVMHHVGGFGDGLSDLFALVALQKSEGRRGNESREGG